MNRRTPTDIQRINPTEPVSQLRRIPIVESGEPLVDFIDLCPLIVLDKPRFKYRRETVVRQSVAEAVCEAASKLPAGIRLAVTEGWRAPYIQQRLWWFVRKRIASMHPDWTDAHLHRVVNRLSAPMDRRVPPPHTTGGAVDLYLIDENGDHLDFISPFEPRDVRAFPFGASGISDTARRNRDLLAKALAATCLTNYPSEWWHWSYGDQGWAYRGGHPQAVFGAVEPQGWAPRSEDCIDAPLMLADET